MASGSFDTDDFEKRLLNLKNTQDGIQRLALWCMSNHVNHKKVVSSWLHVLKQVNVEHRLTLFYLANDVIQNSKRKQLAYVASWGTTLQRATTMVRDESIKAKILRIFSIWEQRGIYDDEFLADLRDLLNSNPSTSASSSIASTPTSNPAPPTPKHSGETAHVDLVASVTKSIRKCVRLEHSTDEMLKDAAKKPSFLSENHSIQTLKDRHHAMQVDREMSDYSAKLHTCTRALKTEIDARRSLLAMLKQLEAFYNNQHEEVKVVVSAYSKFDGGLKKMKRRLEVLQTTLPSPQPSPDINAPSPEPDSDSALNLDEKDGCLAIDESLLNQSNGFLSGFQGQGSLPFNISDFSDQQNASADAEPRDQTAKQPPPDPKPVPPVDVAQYGSLSAYGTVPFFGGPPPPPPQQHAGSSAHSDNDDQPNHAYGASASNTSAVSHYSDEYNPDEWEQDTPDESSDNIGASDVDHRTLNMLASQPISARNVELCRSLDVDHRNLISLTGSPTPSKPLATFEKPSEPDTSASSGSFWSSKMFSGPDTQSIPGLGDTDYRSPSSAGSAANDQNIFQPPMPKVPLLESPGPSPRSLNKQSPLRSPASLKGRGGQRDNVETIDMEMSDEDDTNNYVQDKYGAGHYAVSDTGYDYAHTQRRTAGDSAFDRHTNAFTAPPPTFNPYHRDPKQFHADGDGSSSAAAQHHNPDAVAAPNDIGATGGSSKHHNPFGQTMHGNATAADALAQSAHSATGPFGQPTVDGDLDGAGGQSDNGASLFGAGTPSTLLMPAGLPPPAMQRGHFMGHAPWNATPNGAANAAGLWNNAPPLGFVGSPAGRGAFRGNGTPYFRAGMRGGAMRPNFRANFRNNSRGGGGNGENW